ncbi:YceI family protein [Jiangella mangrovi]|uniref:Polyisoprenoid-binding protein YceI n=1 Tax=Jiangella mangrovi TaxID=1524084 RepID=A0A7W9GNF8_9ACTN|nr:YceI family protein [Jiangella mangrovi]MBB5787085.1 polyisoprenoid-binding protein YceI [Jiangella mangrovi]
MSFFTRRRVLIGVGGLAALVVLVIGGTYLYVNVISGDAPDPLALETNPPPASGGDVDLDGTWTVAGGSEAGYRVDEVLNGQDNTVVGRTSDVTGDITVAGGSATEGEITVDTTTITTDSGSRDSQFRGPILQTDEFPTSTFTLTSPVSLDGLEDGGPITVSATGDLKVRDVTHSIEVQLDVQRSGDGVQVAGSGEIQFADFDVDPPNLGFVKVEDHGTVEFLLTLSKG